MASLSLLRRLVSFSLLASLPLGAAVDDGIAGLTAPGVVLEVNDLDRWNERFRGVAESPTLYARFQEERYFSMRKKPSVLQGELRFSRERGLSLAYTQPREQMMILDSEGILLRNAKGREKRLSAQHDSAGMAQALGGVMALDWKALNERFVIRAVEQGDAWRIDLEPRETKDNAMGAVAMWGTGDLLRRLELQRGEGQRILITVSDRQLGPTFGDEVLERFFR